MINVPSLFARSVKTNKMIDEMLPLPSLYVGNLVAMEMMPGADVRLTIREGSLVRLEALQRPSRDQLATGIHMPWYRDAQDDSSSDYWLWKAARETDLSNLPDGEWAGEAIGPNIKGNPFELEDHSVIFSSLFPWREDYPGMTPPALGRTPFEFEDLCYWLLTTPSEYSPESRLEGVVWWLNESPVAQVRTRDFPTIYRAPNQDADVEVPRIEPEVFKFDA